MKQKRVLIIYAHPDTEGFCSTIRKEVTASLDSEGITYELIDLYEQRYDPVLHEHEHYTHGNRDVSDENKKVQIQIKESDWLIFIYPVWWGSMPAILKGFFDRVFTAGYAYQYVKGIPRGLLTNRSIVFMTSGAPRFLSFLFQMNRPVKTIKNDILGFCGIKSTVYQIGKARKLDADAKKRINMTVARGLRMIIRGR